MSGRFLLAKIQPGNDILSLMALHFSNRFPNENWVIYDEKRQKALCHEKGKECVMRKGVRIQVPGSAVGDMGEYEELWQTFCDSISIEARRNEKLQKQMLALHFRSNMPEFSMKG
ncbi:MAG: DUF4130 domain-containing protein [Ruminococcus sp.]